MSLVSTKTPIFDDIPSIQFFNGRLLTGEDMSTEQAWNAARRRLLGQALGSGVAWGLEVTLPDANKKDYAGLPVVTVQAGLAINADGDLLHLTQPTDVSLTQIPAATAPPADFVTCSPTQYSAYVKSDGVYLLAVCPASGTQGRALMGLANQQASCNRKYRREGVQFRLHQLKLTPEELADRDKLRNLVAYKCFNRDDWQAFAIDPFGASSKSTKLLDRLLVPTLDDSEVPLATVFWTTDGEIEYVDMWSVRRRIAACSDQGQTVCPAQQQQHADRVAMFLQFQEHLTDMTKNGAQIGSVAAIANFRNLPATGILPMRGSTGDAAVLATFFAGLTVRGPAYIEGASLERVLHDSFAYPPIDLYSGELIWLYYVRQNRQTVSGNTTATMHPYLLFANGHMPYQADAHFDLSRFGYANLAIND